MRGTRRMLASLFAVAVLAFAFLARGVPGWPLLAAGRAPDAGPLPVADDDKSDAKPCGLVEGDHHERDVEKGPSLRLARVRSREGVVVRLQIVNRWARKF